MRRFLHHNWFLLLTLLPAFLVAALLIRSYFQFDSLAWSWTAEHHLESKNGTVFIWSDVVVLWLSPTSQKYFAPRYNDPTAEEGSRPLPAWPTWASHTQRNFSFSLNPVAWYGVGYSKDSDLMGLGRHSESSCITIRYWLILLATLLLPAILASRKFVRHLRRSHQPDLCPSCGYDLRMHAPGQRCPECGQAIPADTLGTGAKTV